MSSAKHPELKTIADWMEYIQTLHVREIDLSLDRVDQVYRRMYPAGVSFKVVTVAGTNGKGSTSELIYSIYHHAGYKAAKFTSPHISRFNERFSIADCDVDDDALLAAFARVEEYRDDIRITYFEYGILLAIELFEQAKIEIAVIEVGLGGRLDASNILDADLAIVTSLSIDHVAWLGSTLEEIGREKIGIARTDAPCILGLAEPPQSILDYCRKLSIEPLMLGIDFKAQCNPELDYWTWQGRTQSHLGLPLPFAQRGHQISNAALAVQAVESMSKCFPVNHDEISRGISAASIAGRCQIVAKSPYIVLDVAHNVSSIAGLLEFVEGLKIEGRIHAVCGMLADKQIAESLGQLLTFVDFWHLATIDNIRSAEARGIQDLLQDVWFNRAQNSKGPLAADIQSEVYDSVVSAFHAAKHKLRRDDCLIVFGSFFVVSDIIALNNG
ncbi:MAG: dihydrofolate synthase/folylpolyglutamate synthase [Dinoroseobacter sp.]|jgi:dihydrofolate synthase/folylpolyglutamate synthase